MLHFFPSTFPDETLYSRFARYHRLSGHVHDRDSLHELVGTHTHVAISDLPSLLQTFVSRIPAIPKPSVEEIIDTNTIFPYFQRFLSSERCSRAVAAMSGTSTSGLKAALGLVASRLGAKSRFRFCERCLGDDRLEFGQPYWHRVHQLPGVWVCPKHAQALCELDFGTVQLKRHKLFLPDDPLVEVSSQQRSFASNQMEALLRIALLSASALINPPTTLHLQNLNKLHRENARRNGLVRNNGRVRIDHLAGMLQNYASAFPTAGEYVIVHQHFLDWTLRLLRKPRDIVVHPMRHLLLLDCLREVHPGRLESIVPNPPKTMARNEGRCQVDLARLSEMLGRKGTSLRQAAAELGVSVTTLGIEATRLGLPVGRRPKTITDDIKSRVYTSLRSGLAPKEVANECRLSQVSVYRILRMDDGFAKEYVDQRFKLQRDARRERFARQKLKTDYAWLYRNDKEWLSEQRANTSKGRSQRKAPVDWAERDKFLAKQVVITSDTMRSGAARPQWISRSALKRQSGMGDTIEYNADKLPETHLVLSVHSESREEHQRRRLYWAASELKKSLHGLPPRWQLLRQAGVRVLVKNNEKLVKTLSQDRPSLH